MGPGAGSRGARRGCPFRWMRLTRGARRSGLGGGAAARRLSRICEDGGKGEVRVGAAGARRIDGKRARGRGSATTTVMASAPVIA